MKKTILIILVLLVIGFGMYYYNGSKNVGYNYQTPADNTQTTQLTIDANTIPASESTSTDVSVAIQGFAFTPATLTIKKGTKVTWTNNDNVPHTITSDSGNLLDSSSLSQGASFSFTFNDVGSINYHCAPHPAMKGSIIVTE